MDQETNSPVGAIVFFVVILCIGALAFGPNDSFMPEVNVEGGTEYVR